MSKHHEAIGWRALATWRKAVLTRDSYRCQSCGKYGNQAHHVRALKYHPELALDVSNGSTRCRDCHISETRVQNTDPKRWEFREHVRSLIHS